MNMPAVQPFQMPDIANTAARFLQLRMMRDQVANAATLQERQFQMEQEEQRIAAREASLEVNDYALNLLAGVTSQEDLDIAKRHFIARYPEQRDMVEQMLPLYDPRAVELIRSSLRDETQRMKIEREDEELMGFGAGTMVFRGGEQVGQVPFAPHRPPTPEFEVFEDDAGNQVYIEEGMPIPTGYKKVHARGTQITIQTGDLGKKARSKLEGDIIDATRSIQSYQKTRELFRPEYLTVLGKGRKLTAETLDKLGISSAEQKDFIKERAKWFRQAKADFIAYRKWATGVAGGAQELAEIATSFPDPVRNTPTQYMAHLDNIEETTKRVLMLNVDFLRSGINVDQPLENILSEVKGVPPTVTRIIRFDAQGNRIDEPVAP